MSSYLLALDQGTTSSRAILFDETGRLVLSRSHEFTQFFPKPGWVEHDPNEIYDSQIAAARDVLKDSGISVADVSGIGIANQRETTLLWDRRTGEPIANAIVWQCRRTAGICDQLKAKGHTELIRNSTGLVVDAYFSGTKIQWLLDNVPGARSRAEKGELAFGTMDSWLIYRLTEGRVHVTEPSNASRTMLFNIKEGQWDPEMLRLLKVPSSLLPQVAQSSGFVAETDRSVFGKSLPIAGIAGDQQAALFGQGCFSAGDAKNTYGTGCFMLMQTGNVPLFAGDGLLTTVAWDIGEGLTYAVEGSVFVAGAVIQWLRDQLGILNSAPESEAMAREVADTGGMYLVPAFTGLGAPNWDMYARGLMIGMTRGTNRYHIVRAALESIAYQSRDIAGILSSRSTLPMTSLRVDGGAAANDFLMQFQADILGISVRRPAVAETTAFGAALLAGLGVNIWDDVAELPVNRPGIQLFEPRMEIDVRDRLYRGWQKAVSKSKGWAEPNGG